MNDHDKPEHARGKVTAPVEPLAVGPETAGRLLGLSRSMFFKMVEAGRIGPMGQRFGKCTRYSLTELREWAGAGMPPRHEWQATHQEKNVGRPWHKTK